MARRTAGTLKKSTRVSSVMFIWNKPVRGVDTGQFLKLTVRHYLGYWNGIIFYEDTKHATGYLLNDCIVDQVRYEDMPYKTIVDAMQDHIETTVLTIEAQRDIEYLRGRSEN